MNRLLAITLVLLIPLGVGRAQSPAELARTAAFVASLQNPDGGFAATPGGASSLGSTSSALKVLRFTGGSVKDVPACIAFCICGPTCHAIRWSPPKPCTL